MGADASIFQTLRQPTPQEGPLDSYAKMMSVQQLMGGNQLQDLQRTKLTRDLGRDDAFQGALSDPENQKLSVPDLMRKLQGIDYSRAATLGKTMLETDVAKANLEKTQTETIGARAKQGRDLIASATPENYADIVAQGAALKQQWAATAPPQFDPKWQRDHVMDADKFIAQTTPKMEKVEIKDGQKTVTRMVDTNPYTNPGVKDLNIVTQMQQTPDSIASQETARRGQNMVDARSREQRDIERVKADPMGILGINKNPSGAAVAGSGLSGDDYLKTLPPGVAQQVKAIADGKLQISPMTLRSPQGAALIQMAMQYEPGTDQTVYQSRAATAKDAASGKLSTSNNALNTVSGHLAALSDSADALNNTSIPWVNKLKNFALRNAVPGGDAKLNAFNMNLHGVADELERAYRGAGGSEGAIQEWRRNLGEASSPESFKETMAKGAEMLQSKLEANHAQYVQGMHGKPGDFQTITPKARAALDKLKGVTSETADKPAAAPVAVSQSDIDAELRRRGLKK